MEAVKQLYTVDDVMEITADRASNGVSYELIEGELLEVSPTNLLHSWVAGEVYSFLKAFARQHKLGTVFFESGHQSRRDSFNLLGPDVAFVSRDKLPDDLPEAYADFMPDLAVELLSPTNTKSEIERKIDIYLRNGTELVWIVKPRQKCVEVCRLDDDGAIETETVSQGESLSGETVLPGFKLPIAKLFPEKKR